MGFPDSSVGKEPTCNAGDPCSIPGSGRSTGEGIGYPLQYSWASLVTQLVKNLLQCGRPEFNPWVGKIPWRRARLPTPVFLPGELHGLYSPWGHKESDMTERLSLYFKPINNAPLFIPRVDYYSNDLQWVMSGYVGFGATLSHTDTRAWPCDLLGPNGTLNMKPGEAGTGVALLGLASLDLSNLSKESNPELYLRRDHMRSWGILVHNTSYPPDRWVRPSWTIPPHFWAPREL